MDIEDVALSHTAQKNQATQAVYQQPVYKATTGEQIIISSSMTMGGGAMPGRTGGGSRMNVQLVARTLKRSELATNGIYSGIV